MRRGEWETGGRGELGMEETAAKPEPRTPSDSLVVAAWQEVEEEQLWLYNKKSEHTRRAYRSDVAKFMEAFGLTSAGELRRATGAMLIAWRHQMEAEGLTPRTINRRLATLSDLFDHYRRKGIVASNPVDEVERLNVSKDGVTAAFSSEQAAQLLDLPDTGTLKGVRDRAILSVLLQGGLRRSEVARLTVGSFCEMRGYPALKFTKKGGTDQVVVLHPMTAARIRDYLQMAGHGECLDAPLFQPVRCNQNSKGKEQPPLSPQRVNKILKEYAQAMGIERGYSAHSCRATFITEARKRGGRIEDIQKVVGHADPATTQRYDRYELEPENSVTFLVNYGS